MDAAGVERRSACSQRNGAAMPLLDPAKKDPMTRRSRPAEQALI
jgi:hypothetical protein